jgi:ABC-type multidrug transport system fused ATPase/permease subunit
MKFDFDFFSFVIGALLGAGSVWKLLQHRIKKTKRRLKQAEAGNEIRNQLFELMALLKDKREFFADLRDGKIDIDGVQPDILNQLQTEIDSIYDDIVVNENQLAKIENRKPRRISKSHGGRPAPA